MTVSIWIWLALSRMVFFACAKHLDAHQLIEPTTQLYGTKWEFDVFTGFVHADAVGKTAIVIRDRQTGRVFYPGPTLVVPEGSTLDVTFYNKMDHVSMSIHWHGIEQRRSPWMDGVPSVTQEPIQCGHWFRYLIPLLAQTGTYWWHSHSANQYTDGLVGGLVIRPALDKYDVFRDVVLLLQEFYHRESTTIDGELAGNVWASSEHFPDWESGLINGRGSSVCRLTRYDERGYEHANVSLLCSEAYNFHYTLQVVPNARYRLRLINVASGYTLRFWVQGHRLSVVAIDGKDIEPHECDEVYVYVAQRYDVILTANQAPSSYLMRVRTLPEANGTYFETIGILQYVSPTTPEAQQQTLRLQTTTYDAREPQTSLIWEESVSRAAYLPSPPAVVHGQIPLTVRRTRVLLCVTILLGLLQP